MNIIVRNEEPKDHRRTEEVAREAFWNLYFPGAAEHYVVHKMRSHPDFIQELAFVIEVDGNEVCIGDYAVKGFTSFHVFPASCGYLI